jgi:hypothetical protein
MNLTESSFSFNETEEGWVYNIFLTPMIVKYLDKVLPASIETRREVLAGGQPFLRESWFVIGLPTVSSFQDHSTAFVIEAIAFVDEVIASARSAGHLTATVEAKIADSNYHANANKAITEGMEELVEELSDNPAALMLAGTDFRFGFAASSPAMVDFAPNHFNFEIPTDRQVIEVVTMFDMFARMGLTQMQGEWEEEEAF